MQGTLETNEFIEIDIHNIIHFLLKSTWNVQERSWSPSWTYWSIGKDTPILFSFVREAIGNERVTTCSPTA